ncbi:MAG: MazG nucleotide pyrophosphohydrolase domain-containing protein [Candidatus Komeilibacteria bacterium]
MTFQQVIKRAKNIRAKYKVLETKKYGQPWTTAQIAEGFIGDVGDLLQLVMAKQGVRDIKNVNAELKHELSDCLWAIIVLADAYQIDLEKAFFQTMDELEARFK